VRIKVVINPGAGQPEPVLSVLNDTFGSAGIEWDVAVTHGPGDGRAAALEAVEQGYDLVGAYGGDGTVSEVASALALGGPPMVILPGGTGNALAADLGIPAKLIDAAALVAGGEYDIFFILRLTMGFEASVVEAATRESKDRFGWLAYAFAGLQALSDPPTATYRMEVDGEAVEASGLACVLANSAATGVSGASLAEGVDVSDGMLDLFVIDLPDLASLLGSAADAAAGQQPRGMTRWRAKQVRIKSRPKQSVLADGEDAGATPVEVSVAPGAISVVVPKAATPG
jgi:diacylglycerol kinase family enzyme